MTIKPSHNPDSALPLEGWRDGDQVQGEQGERGRQGPPGNKQSPLDRWALFVVVVVTAISAAFFAVRAQNRLDDAEAARAQIVDTQQAMDKQVACQGKLNRQTILALKARSSFAEQQAQATLHLLLAQRHYLTVAGQPEITPAEAIAALGDYLEALQFDITATGDQLRIRDRNPYPTGDAIARCLVDRVTD